MVAATVSLAAEVAVNSAGATYLSAAKQQIANTANLANGAVFKFTLDGFTVPTSANGQTHNASVKYNVLVGANGNTTDNLVYSITESDKGNQIKKELTLTLRANGANNIWLGTSNGSISNATVNVASGLTMNIGVSVVLVGGTDTAFGFVEQATAEQLV